MIVVVLIALLTLIVRGDMGQNVINVSKIPAAMLPVTPIVYLISVIILDVRILSALVLVADPLAIVARVTLIVTVILALDVGFLLLIHQ